MNTITIEQIAVLVSVINSNDAMTAEQFAECKQVALSSMMKSLNSEAVTAEEVTVAAYVTRTMQGIVNKAQKEADRDAKFAQAEAEYTRLMQEHKIALNGGFALHVAKLLNSKKEVICKFADLAELKDWFGGFVATLEAEPKKPLMSDFEEKPAKKAKKTGDGTTTGTWNKTADVTKLREGSTLHVLWTRLVAAGDSGLTKDEMESIMFVGFPERTKQNNKFSVYEATAGRLPLVKGERTLEAVGSDAPVVLPVWIAVVPVVNDPILEVVENKGDADTETPKTDGEAAK